MSQATLGLMLGIVCGEKELLIVLHGFGSVVVCYDNFLKQATK